MSDIEVHAAAGGDGASAYAGASAGGMERTARAHAGPQGTVETADWLGIASAPLDRAAVDRFLADKTAGAVLVFAGVVRDHHDGRRVRHLEYETYGEMARRQIAGIAAAIRARWLIGRLALLHRAGRLEIGEIAVIVGVAAPHRAEAFEACRFGIDQIKAEVAIWKKEFYADGSAAWQDNRC